MHAAAGTGKTYMGLTTAHCLGSERIIVVCPKNALNKVWVENVKNVFIKPQSFWVSDQDKEYADERIVLVHYESLSKVLHFVAGFKGIKTTVILDESHNFNDVGSLRTATFLELCRITNASDVLLASGTPIKALGKETIPLFRSVDPLFTDKVEESFKSLYGKDPTRGAEVLKARLGTVSFVIEKGSIDVSKPIIVEAKVKIPDGHLYTLSSIAAEMKAFVAARKEYYAGIMDDAKKFYEHSLNEHEKTLRTAQQKDAFALYKKNISIVQANYKTMSLSECPVELRYCNAYELKNIIPSLHKDDGRRFKEIRSVIKYVGLKIQGECLGRVLSRKRIECHVSMCAGIDFETYIDSTENKTVVFTSFTEVLVAAEKRVKELGYSPITVYGVNNKDRDSSITKFASIEEVNPLIATFASLSTAVPLVMADTMIMIDTPFRAYIQEQAISRTYRLGQTSETTVYRVSLDTGEEKNISTRSVDILKWSQDQVEMITGIKSPFDVSEDGGNLVTEGYDLITEALNTPSVFLIEAGEETPWFSKW